MPHRVASQIPDPCSGDRSGVLTGVIGQPWRALVTPWGAIVPNDGRRLDWWVAASDRWHTPADEPAVRQTRVESTPVTETRLRVPNGDVVQRVYSVADDGGLTIVEFANESTLPVAIALSHRDVLTERPIADVAIEGIDLPADAFVMPLGHQASVRVAIVHSPASSSLATSGVRLRAGLPAAPSVVRGWTSTVERSGRYVLPDGDMYAEAASAVVAERCDMMLAPMPFAADDPARLLISLDSKARMGEPVGPWIEEIAVAVAAVGPDTSWRATAALRAAERLVAATDERRAQRDLRRILDRRPATERPPAPPDDVTRSPWLDEFLIDGGRVLVEGLPEAWRGQSVEVYNVPNGPRSAVSYALRWHGENVAILWEQNGEPVELTAPALDPHWSSTSPAGEALLRLDR